MNTLVDSSGQSNCREARRPVWAWAVPTSDTALNNRLEVNPEAINPLKKHDPDIAKMIPAVFSIGGEVFAVPDDCSTQCRKNAVQNGLLWIRKHRSRRPESQS
jgi:hypothetical protein